MLDRRGAGYQKDIRRPLQQPRQRHLHGSRSERRSHFVEPRRLQGRKSSEWKVRHIGDTLRGQIVNESVVATLGQVIEVLDANNLRDSLRLGQLLGRDRTKANMLNQALVLEVGER